MEDVEEVRLVDEPRLLWRATPAGTGAERAYRELLRDVLARYRSAAGDGA